MIGFDTTALIDFFNENKDLKKLLDILDDSFCTTIINYQEIIFGVDMEDNECAEEIKFYESLFDNIITMVHDKTSCNKASEVYWNLAKKGNMIDKFDSMIAGVFLANGVNKIITRNVKHFEKVPGLKIISY